MLGYNPKSKIKYLNIYPLTCVYGYWNIINKHDNKCESRFQYTLKINVTSTNYYHHISLTYLHKNIVNNLIDTQY